jgi:hypothetical protein
LVKVVKCQYRLVTIELYLEGCKRVRNEDVMQQDDCEQDIQSFYEDAAGYSTEGFAEAAIPRASLKKNLTA